MQHNCRVHIVPEQSESELLTWSGMDTSPRVCHEAKAIYIHTYIHIWSKTLVSCPCSRLPIINVFSQLESKVFPVRSWRSLSNNGFDPSKSRDHPERELSCVYANLWGWPWRQTPSCQYFDQQRKTFWASEASQVATPLHTSSEFIASFLWAPPQFSDLS